MSLKIRTLLVLAAGGVLGVTVSAGARMLIGTPHAQKAAPLTVAGLSPKSMQRLTKVLERVHTRYIGRINDQRLVDSAIQGVLEDLDAHSRYLDRSHYADVRINTAGSYSGIGLDVSLKGGQLTVMSAMSGAPAQRVGVKPGDRVVAVDGIPVDRDHMERAVARMRGMPGTPISLTVRRAGRDNPVRFTMRRARIHIPTVHAAYLGDGYGYIRLTEFSYSTPGDLRNAATQLLHDAPGPLNGVILDLRGNPGGVLKAAAGVADVFLNGGLIVRGDGRIPQSHFAKYASAGGLLETVPVVVLVDGGTASAAEIVAGALQDHHRARLVGVRTYGKGSVQTLLPVGDGRAIKLTTALYVTPSGRSINGVGIKPDVVVCAGSHGRQFHVGDGAVARTADRQLSVGLWLLGYHAAPTSPASLNTPVMVTTARASH